MQDRPTVGLTFFLREKESIWNNGAAQNCVFLLRMLRESGMVGCVLALNGGESKVPDKALMLDGLDIEFVPIAEAIDQVDVLIEAAAQVSAENVERVHARGGKAVAFRFGNAYAIETERAIHDKKPGAIVNGARFDEVWTNPQHVNTCASYWEAVFRCPVRVLPHVWMPTFANKAVSEFPEGLAFGYQPGRTAKRIGTFEPNINLVKTAIVPLLACELLYRRHPELVGDVYITNSLHLKEHLTFQSMASHLDIVRAHVASFEGRFNTPFFMARYCDVMLAHQWENGLNYAYYDALHGGYPLVHNSDLLPDGVGYRYDGFDAHDAAAVLQHVAQHHDAEHEDYERRASRFLCHEVNALAPQNVAAYERALVDLVEARAAA